MHPVPLVNFTQNILSTEMAGLIMPDHKISTRKVKGNIRSHVTMRKGEVISLCRCWQSKNFPLCDSTHKDLDDEKGPVTISTDCDHSFLDGAEN